MERSADLSLGANLGARWNSWWWRGVKSGWFYRYHATVLHVARSRRQIEGNCMPPVISMIDTPHPSLSTKILALSAKRLPQNLTSSPSATPTKIELYDLRVTIQRYGDSLFGLRNFILDLKHQIQARLTLLTVACPFVLLSNTTPDVLRLSWSTTSAS